MDFCLSSMKNYAFHLVWCCSVLCLIRCASSGRSLCVTRLISFLLIWSIFLCCASCSRFAYSIWFSCGSLFDLIFSFIGLALMLFYSYSVLAELEEGGVGSISGYRPSSLKEFLLAPIHPPLVAFSGPSIGIRAGLFTN
jgi:hypothetical protein